MKRIKIYLTAALILMLMFLSPSCTKDFEELNTNPNSPGLSQAAPEMLLTNAIESMTDRVHEIFFGHEMGSCWAQHMAKVQYTDEDRYIPRIAVINNTWNSFYAASGNDVQTLYNIAFERNSPSYQGVALILKSYIMSVLTDEFGDAPYSEAFMGTADEPIVSPAYDTQEFIYAALLANLDEANTLLTGASDVEGDILFDGDVMMWRKFGNTLRLRLLLRRSDRVDPTADMTTIVGNPATYPIIEGNDEDVELQYLGSAPNNNPINENRKTRDDHRVSATLVDMMWNSGAIEPDYRLMAYAEVAASTGDYVGIPNGLLSAVALGYLGNGLAETSKIGRYFEEATAPGVLISYSELQFILAEAAHLDFIPGGDGDAKTYYTEGISSSYYKYTHEIEIGIEEYYGTPPGAYLVDDMLEWYLADGGWGYSPANAMEQICTQRWFAMFGQGVQAAFEWRRTGFPDLLPGADNANGDKIPVRCYYPSDEHARNPTNVDAAIAIQGADDLDTRVWWDIADNY